MSETKAVIFDIDDTLSPGNAWVFTTFALGASLDEHLRIYQEHKDGVISGNQATVALTKLWRATGNATKPFFQQIFDNLSLFDGAQEVISQTQERYERVCLITGSMDLFANTVARKLGVDEWYANAQLQWDEQGSLAGLTYALDQRATKLDQFTTYCVKHSIEPSECIVVGDGDNDIDLFEATGRGVAIGENIPQALQEVAWKSTVNLRTLLSEL